MSMKKLGFGLMRLPRLDPNDPAAIDIDHVAKMVDAFMEKGFTYFDTAWLYCGFQSERIAKKVLVDRYPRDSFTLATKLHSAYFNSLEERDEIFKEQCNKTGCSYFDYYLLHNIDSASYLKYEKYDCFTWLREKKEQGLVKHIGFSYHDNADLLDKILTLHPEIEFVQLQLNYLDWESEWIQSRKCYEVVTRHGKPVVVMEPVKGGTLTNIPEKAEATLKAANPDASLASWAIRFAASLDNVMVVLSGMSNMDQLLDNVGYMDDFKPLTAEEQAVVAETAEIIRSTITVPCTGCSYCTDGCPMNIAIPQYFSLYNAEKQEVAGKSWTPNPTYYKHLAEKHGKAGDCIGCAQCESVCPQHLPIVDFLKDVSALFDKE